MHLGHMSGEAFKPYIAKEFYQLLNIANSTYVNFALWARQLTVVFTASVHKTKGLLDLIHTDV